MSHYQEVLSASKRNYLMIAHRARSDDRISLNDLSGASGRWDGVARAITSALFLSHSMRRDTAIHILLLGPDDPPKLLSVQGESVRYLNPDERASAALMKKCLSQYLPPDFGAVIRPSPGITVTRADLGSILETFEGAMFYLDEDGRELDENEVLGSPPGPLLFILSDDQNLTGPELSLIKNKVRAFYKLGESVLHSHMAITIVNFLLDRYLR